MTNRPTAAAPLTPQAPSPRSSRAKQALRSARGAATGIVGRYRHSWLTLLGLVLLTAAAWTLDLAAGLAAAGVSCLVLEYLRHRERSTR